MLTRTFIVQSVIANWHTASLFMQEVYYTASKQNLNCVTARQQYEGTGLVALTRKLARLHGGDVTVQSWEKVVTRSCFQQGIGFSKLKHNAIH